MEYKGEERREQWYSNKDLFERMEKISKIFNERADALEKTLAKTEQAVKEYNGLRQKLDKVCSAVEIMQAEGVGKNKLMNGIGWTIGIIGAIIGIAGGILAIASIL